MADSTTKFLVEDALSRCQNCDSDYRPEDGEAIGVSPTEIEGARIHLMIARCSVCFASRLMRIQIGAISIIVDAIPTEFSVLEARLMIGARSVDLDDVIDIHELLRDPGDAIIDRILDSLP